MKRFRLTDVLVAAGCAAMILTVTFVARQNAQTAQDVAVCASHLTQIHAAVNAYQLDARTFPRTLHVPDAPITAYTGALPGQAVQPNDVSAAAFLLVRSARLGPDVFNCPAALRNGLAEKDDFDPANPAGRANFKARVNYNYSLANMYPSPQAVNAGYDLTALDAGFVLASDTNPGEDDASSATTRMTVREIRTANSPNHRRDGQNLLFGDGSVRFYGSPFVRDGADNVYASSGTFPDPGSSQDAVLLPVWSAGPDVTPHAVTLRRWVFSIALVISTGMIVWIVVRGTRRAKESRA